MPFIPHTQEDINAMLASIGVDRLEELFAEIPSALKISELSDIPVDVNEMTLLRQLKTQSEQDNVQLNFIGAGAYEHHIPAPIWDIVSRGEWMTAYTPYQAEASQGTLQLLYEYQTMMARLMHMEVSNASLYDGASSLAEALLMALRLRSDKSSPCILMPKTVNPFYRATVHTLVQANVEIIEVPFCEATGRISKEELFKYQSKSPVAVVIPHPNFLGVLEDVDMFMEFAQRCGALVIGVVNPISMALLQPPGAWGEQGADIVCGEGQSLGIPLSSGGPYFGFLCCKKEHIRQLPGRLIGRTTDKAGKEGFVLTLQAREQHIRRAKATSNICTNQGLLVTAATLYLALLGFDGLYRVAVDCHLKTKRLKDLLSNIKGIKVLFEDEPFFHELVIKITSISNTVDSVMAKLVQKGIESGFALNKYYSELGETLLLCVTETKTEEDLFYFAQELQLALEK